MSVNGIIMNIPSSNGAFSGSTLIIDFNNHHMTKPVGIDNSSGYFFITPDILPDMNDNPFFNKFNIFIMFYFIAFMNPNKSEVPNAYPIINTIAAANIIKTFGFFLK